MQPMNSEPIDINNVADHINTTISTHDLHVSNDIDDNGVHSDNNPVTINVSADGIAINGCTHTEPIYTITTTPASNSSLAYVTAQFVIGKLTVATDGLTATQDEAGVIHFNPIRE